MLDNSKKREISIAIVGAPNSGKTSLYNHISGEHEHTGNYSGVTVDATSSSFNYKGYKIEITDFPGVNALSTNTPDELYIRRFIASNQPDVILNVVCASNLERNLYPTTELIDMKRRMVVALSMYDELNRNGATLDHELLGKMMGVPIIPVEGHNGKGVEKLLDAAIEVYEERDSRVRHIHISQGVIEESVIALSKAMKVHREELPTAFPPRYFAMKMLEDDSEVKQMLASCPHYSEWQHICEKERQHLKYDLGTDEDIQTTMANQKRGFIMGALRETFTKGEERLENLTNTIDAIVTHRILGYPIFLMVMWLMFYCTFSLGQYPQQWFESLIGLISQGISHILPNGILKDLVVDGIIGGVGSVIVFLPNIMILYLFISFLEDSGYLTRAAFIMDKFMHKVGLHGKSFIPLVMGFGCNVPAITATRAIESRSSQIITAFIIPFISCSARLPVYILLLGTFFGAQSGTLLFGIYLLGILVATVTSLLLRRFKFSVDETPFVMELPPYRTPTLKAIISHMWEKCAQYLKKMGGLILVASIVIWALSYFPLAQEGQTKAQHYENSYIGRLGKSCEPIFKPLGMNWKTSVAVLSGISAKEIMVSTIGVLYTDAQSEQLSELEQEQTLHHRLVQSGDFTKGSVLALIVFTLLYFPCIATLAAIGAEYGKRWAIASAVYSTSVAWLFAFVIYQISKLL